MFRRFRTLAALAAAAIACVSVPACGGDDGAGDDGAGDESGGVLKVAFLGALSGPQAAFGVPGVNVYKTLAQQYNAEGGIKVGDKRYKVEIVAHDSKADPAMARSLATKIVYNDKAKFMSSPGDPHDVVAASLTERAKVIQMDFSANKQLLGPKYKYIFNTFESPNTVAEPFFKEIMKLNPKVRSAYHIAFDLGFDRKNTAWDKEAATKAGLEWLGAGYFPASTVDFSSIVTPAVRANPDMVILGSTGGLTPAIIKTLRQQGFKGVISSPVVAQGLADTVEGAGEYANGFYQAEMHTYPETPGLVEFRKAYEKVSGGKWDSLAPGYWINASTLFAGIQAAGTTDDTTKIAAALEDVELRNPLIEGSPTARMGGEETYGQPREMAMPVAVNQAVNGKLRTRAVVPVSIP